MEQRNNRFAAIALSNLELAQSASTVHDTDEAPTLAHVSLEVSLAAIEAFVVAANHSSLSDAARVCGLKEDTFRKRLDAVEKWAGVALIQRRPDLILTTDGARFLPFATEACAQIRKFRERLSFPQILNMQNDQIAKVESGTYRRRNKAAGSYFEMD